MGYTPDDRKLCETALREFLAWKEVSSNPGKYSRTYNGQPVQWRNVGRLSTIGICGYSYDRSGRLVRIKSTRVVVSGTSIDQMVLLEIEGRKILARGTDLASIDGEELPRTKPVTGFYGY